MKTYPYYFSSQLPPEKIEEILGHTNFWVDNEDRMFIYYFKDEADFLLVQRSYEYGDDGYNDYYDDYQP